MSDPALIVNLFQQTIVGNTSSIKGAEENLKILEEDPSFVNHLLLIPKQSSVPSNIQKAAILYTKTYTKHCFHLKNLNKINQLSEGLMNFMADPQIKLAYRKYAASTLDYVMQYDRDSSIKKFLFENIISVLDKALKDKNSNIDPVFLGLYIEILLSSSQQLNPQLVNFIRSIFLGFCAITSRLISHACEIIGKEIIEEIVTIFQILKIYSYSFKLFCRKFPVIDTETMKLLFDNQITELINMGLQFEMKGNELNTSLIYYKKGVNQELVNLYHLIKADFITGLKYILKALTTKIKESQILGSNAIIQKPMLIPLLISSIEQLFMVMPYHKIPNQNLVKLLEEIYDCLLIAVRSTVYYSTFNECKQSLIQGCIFKTLILNEDDYDNHIYYPSEFIDSLFQIIDKDPTQFVNTRKHENAYEDKESEVQTFDNLRTVAATLLADVCAKQDGVLSEVFTYIFKVLQGEIQSQFPKSLLLLVLGILREQVSVRVDFQDQVMQFLFFFMSKCKTPKINDTKSEESLEKNEENVQLSVALITLMKYINSTNSISPDLFTGIFTVIHGILSGEGFIDALKFIAFELIQVISSFCEGGMASKLLQMLNIILTRANQENIVMNKLLQTILQLIKINDEQISQNLELTVQTLNNLSIFILNQIKKNNSNSSMAINKAWNVLSEMCENDYFVPIHIPEIEKAVIPLLPYADGEKFDFQENILLMLTAFINKSKQITHNQLLMFDIIPKLFYSTYDKQFGHAFETLQIFIFHGGQILTGNLQAIKSIIQMTITSMNTFEGKGLRRTQADNCEGVLLLQSLILVCGKVFDSQIWMVVTNAIDKRLENPQPKTNILQANLLATISLILMLGHNNFSPENKTVLVNKILQNVTCFRVEYAPKVIIAAFSEMITFNQPFIINNFQFILSFLIELIQRRLQPFEVIQPCLEEKDYENVLTMMKNVVTQMNAVEYFKTKLNEMKNINPVLLEKGLNSLSEEKRNCLAKVFSSSDVEGDQRTVFRIKKEE